MNTLFLATDLSIFTFSGSYSIGNATDKLLDYRSDTYWRSASKSNQALVVTRSVLSPVDALGIAGENFDELEGLITFEADDDPAFGSPTTLFTFSASSDPAVYTFPETSLSYLRIYFEDPGVRPRISEIFIGSAVEIDAYIPPFMVENIEANSNSGESLLGIQRTSRRFDPRVRMSIKFDYLTEATRSAIADLVETTKGRGRPFFFRTYEGVTRFVRFVEDYSPTEVRGWNLNATQVLSMRTQETSGLWNLQGPNSTGSTYISPTEIGPLPDLKFIVSVS